MRVLNDGRLRRLADRLGLFVGGFCLGYVYSHMDEQWYPNKSLLIFSSSAPDPPQTVGIGSNVPVAPGQSRASQIMQYGYPGFDNLRTFEDYVLSYDQRNRIPHWVFEHLTPDKLQYDPSVDRNKCKFRPDNSVHQYFRAHNEDFLGSGFDRGHMAAAGNHRRTQTSVDQTFLLSNMAPQIGKGFNRDKWNDLEKRVRALARRNPNVYVCTGPLFLPRQDGGTNGELYVRYRVIGKNHVAVPTHFFKVVLVQLPSGGFSVESYVLPNAPIANETPLSKFFAPVSSIERAAGFLIFDKLPHDQVVTVNEQPATRATVW